ncbi:sugar transport permease BglB [Oceanicola granulosus HTCC2516]|uniref:Sugar transport permease BglB n=1 Tax=Oceanicola granulosus (strain ATCC BAA-861 / DSM 15982 / KCTC 12143 / HTCC2516) TaxID=314256 RepID=Q2CGR7_OCEGH|nr:carbohydrate ABC transporter permease [Oceanicola granulosus]EAR51868.1 sugar transport permease BglB [Oceanicola granulosus HTCC2516]
MRRSNPEKRFKLIVTIALLCLSVIFIMPLYWTAVFSTRTLGDVFNFPPPLWFGTNFDENYARVAEVFPPWRPVMNSLIVAVPKTVGLVLVSALAGYGFARYTRAPGHRFLLLMAFATLFFPPTLALIPFFLQMSWMGWLNTFWPLIIPALASGFGVIWMYTYIGSTVPRELYEAAEMDGSRGLATFFFVVLPIIRPGLAALGVWTLIQTWSEFQLPLVILGDGSKFTVPLALTSLSRNYFSDTPAVMVATLLGLIPVFILFALLSRQFVAGLTAGAVK